jgi:hypothetical protein
VTADVTLHKRSTHPLRVSLYQVQERINRVGRSASIPRIRNSIEAGRVMPHNKLEEYRANAKECEERASSARDPLIKAQLLELAVELRRVANEEEERKR